MPKFFLLENKKFPKIIEVECKDIVKPFADGAFVSEEGSILYLTYELARKERLKRLEFLAEMETKKYNELIKKINKWKQKK